MRYLKYPDISDAVSGLAVRLDESELLRIGLRTRSPLRYVREAGRRSPAMWRSDDFLSWLSRRLRHAPEIFEEIELRLARGPLATPKTRKKAITS